LRIFIITSSKAKSKTNKGKRKAVGSSSDRETQASRSEGQLSGSETETVHTEKSQGRVTSNLQRAGLAPGISTVYRGEYSQVQKAAAAAFRSLETFDDSFAETEEIAGLLQNSLNKLKNQKRKPKMDPTILDQYSKAEGTEKMSTGNSFPPSYAKNHLHYKKSQVLDYLAQCEGSYASERH
jgi:hypothetical protein